MEYIIHSAPSLPLHLLAERDERRGLALHDRGTDQAGYLSITRAALHAAPEQTNKSENASPAIWGRRTISDLIEDYLVNANSLLPIVTREELELASDSLLGYTAALVASTKRDCPTDVFHALRQLVNKEVIEQGETSSCLWYSYQC